MAIFRDRKQAGEQLAEQLTQYAKREDAVVLGLARGGIVVAEAVARALDLPLDVFLVRKLGVPGNEELALGAIASGGVQVLNKGVIADFGIGVEQIRQITEREMRELERREQAYRGKRPPVKVESKLVILVDDGLATGASMRAAIRALRNLHPSRIVVAVPTASTEACADLQNEADEMICLQTPIPFLGVGAWYEDFPQVSDDEVRRVLEKSRK
jgi:putative phosphoribosyl transferase